MTKLNAHVYYLSEAAFSFRSQSFWLSEKPCLPLLKELGPADVGVSLKDESPVNTPCLRNCILIIAVDQYVLKRDSSPIIDSPPSYYPLNELELNIL